ncbi:MAG: FkbM family methyltransferase [Moorea sp. SIOASIH]|uniref:FkbM family methyltransferase n=1 Tax=Moorena sp. SIOASIH TaxID=2607817 RepID=UPI0013B751A2|nr:FkbM family methyltransferase [Moorena sp. SIOASIH]NEO42591.1 FkbM family methyltransferase [Moorena sp. SIOASIH]
MYNKLWMLDFFQNSREIVKAIKYGIALPPLLLKNGFTIFHDCEEVKGNDLADIIRVINQIILGRFESIFCEQFYTNNEFYKPGNNHVILDIGAHIGLFALYCNMQDKSNKLHCFEPAKATVNYLKKNVIQNGLQDAIRIYPYAILDKTTTMTLRSSQATETRSLFKEKKLTTNNTNNFLSSPEFMKVIKTNDSTERVQCISLEQALQLANTERVDFLKIHVQGAEVEIVTGASEAVWQKINKVALIYHEYIRPGCSDLLVKVLTSHGFSTIMVEPDSQTSGGVGVIRASK